MELSIANQIVQKDPNRALQIARKNLKTRLSSNLMSTLSILRQKIPRWLPSSQTKSRQSSRGETA
jgi:hypothetical protein